MENSQLSDTLRSFTKTEFREFGKFLRSPYHNNRNEVVRFFDALKKYHPLFKKSRLFTQEKLFKEVYPKKKYNDVLMRKLISLMTAHAADFWAFEHFKKSDIEYNVGLLNILREKKQPSLFEKKSKATDKLLSRSKHSIEYLESKYKYTSTVNGYLLVKNERAMIRRFQNELDDFIGYFLFVTLIQYIRLSEWSRHYNITFDMKFYDEVLSFLSKNESENTPLVSLYYKMLMLLNTNEEKYFFELLKERNKNEKILSQIDDYNIAIVLIQYCHNRVQKGDFGFRNHQYNITKLILKNNLIPPGYIEPYFFTNIVRNAANINEFNWTEEFIKNYKDKLNPEFEKEAVNYSLAMLEFSKGNYEGALKLLSAINIERSNMKIDIKNMLIMIYYELNYSEELISLIDTYKHFLHRDNEMVKHVKDKNILFIKLISSLVKVRFNKNNTATDKLRDEIEKKQYFSSKEWLLKKIEELKKGAN